MTTIIKLPPGVISIIFSFSEPTPEKLAKWATVSRLFFQATADNILWKDLISQDFPLYQMPTKIVSFKELYKQICQEIVDSANRNKNVRVRVCEETRIISVFTQGHLIFKKTKIIPLFTTEIIAFFSSGKSLLQKVHIIKTHLNATRSDAFESSLMETIDDKENDENYQLIMDLGAEKSSISCEVSKPSFPSFSFKIENFHKRKRELFEK